MSVPNYAGLHKPTVPLLLTLLSARLAPHTALPPSVAPPPVRRGWGCSGEDVVSSPLGNTETFYHLVQLTKHEHNKSGYH
jgi:hypothetical protein